MPYHSDITFLRDRAEEHLEKFTSEIRTTKNALQWHCLYTHLDPNITTKYDRKKIASASLDSMFSTDADEIKAFWTTSGHLFLFFQGPVRAIIKDFEGFLDFVSDGETPNYHFFWQLQEFWGYFDEVLAKALSERKKQQPKDRDASEKENDFPISDDLRRQRQARYRPLALIVEDDGTTRHMMQAIMEKYCDIAVAWNVKQAKNFYQTMLPNITLLDIELPDGNGKDLAELFCSHDQDACVIMASGSLDKEAVMHCVKAGVKGCIPKPVTEKQLISHINQYHETREKQRKLG